jgi:hypothetical protein
MTYYIYNATDIEFDSSSHLKAEEYADYDKRATIKLYGHLLSYAPPEWVFNDTVNGVANTFRDEKPGSFLFEQIPSTEDFGGDWTILHNISAARIPDIDSTTRKVMLQEYSIYEQACSARHLIKKQVISLSKDETIIIDGCSQFNFESLTFKNDEVRGELCVGYRTVVPGAFITRQLIWRSYGGFDAKDPSTYPATKAEIDEAITLLSDSHIVPNTGQEYP